MTKLHRLGSYAVNSGLYYGVVPKVLIRSERKKKNMNEKNICNFFIIFTCATVGSMGPHTTRKQSHCHQNDPKLLVLGPLKILILISQQHTFFK